jgi:Flp pilus assembly protein TadD
MFGWMLTATLALSTPAPALESTAPAAPETILALPAELRARLQAEVIAGEPSRTRRFERLVNFMFAPQGLGMRYEAEPTPTVSEAYATRQANCLGFTLLFLALAREAGLDVYPREIRETLDWQQLDRTIYRATHVNAGVRLGARHFVVDVAREDVISRHRPARISDQELIAHYYNNSAIERLARGDIATALAHSRLARELNPDDATYWANAGVLYLRSGDEGGAERAYARALELDPREAGALFNLVNWCRRQHDARCEETYRRRLERVQKEDPFYHFLLATDFERRGDYAQAIAHYQRAIHRYRDEPRFYTALAHAYRQNGDARRADRAQARAQSLTERAARASARARSEALR